MHPVGFEPTRSYEQRILSPYRIPIPTWVHRDYGFTFHTTVACTTINTLAFLNSQFFCLLIALTTIICHRQMLSQFI